MHALIDGIKVPTSLLGNLNETDLNDYDLQTRETLLVSIEQISREQFSSDIKNTMSI